jgi:predicted phosphoadenosine phosphosulfate sulfurtransferase
VIGKIERLEGYMSDMEVIWESWSEQQREEWMRRRREELGRMVREAERITGAKIEMKMETIVDPQSLKNMLEEIRREIERKMAAVLTGATATAERTF